jgi:hypothetical protein
MAPSPDKESNRMFEAAADVKKLEAALADARRRGKTGEARALQAKLKTARARAGSDAAVYLATIVTPTIL